MKMTPLKMQMGYPKMKMAPPKMQIAFYMVISSPSRNTNVIESSR